ncbi:uncharacterized protein METZ01_LOCUS327078 [marine metagenome]|uniref:Uncharacterized protein n=1 Tax=marine metagenome TaxID=408172 RepID=A0A382PLG4_9ZZZZ
MKITQIHGSGFLSEVMQARASDPKPKKIKPNKGNESPHPMRNKFVGEEARLVSSKHDLINHVLKQLGDEMMDDDKLLKLVSALTGHKMNKRGDIGQWMLEPIEEDSNTLEEVKRWQAIAAAVAILAGLWGVNNKLAQTAYDNSPQLQELIQLHQKYENTPGEQAEDYVDQLEDRIRNHKTRLDIGKGEVMGSDGRPIDVIDPGAPIGDMGGADFNWPGDPSN